MVASGEGREGEQSLVVEVRHFTARLKAGEADVSVPLADGHAWRAEASQPAAPLRIQTFFGHTNASDSSRRSRGSRCSFTSQHSSMLALLYLKEALYMQDGIVKSWENSQIRPEPSGRCCDFPPFPDGEVEDVGEVGQTVRDSDSCQRATMDM